MRLKIGLIGSRQCLLSNSYVFNIPTRSDVLKNRSFDDAKALFTSPLRRERIHEPARIGSRKLKPSNQIKIRFRQHRFSPFPSGCAGRDFSRHVRPSQRICWRHLAFVFSTPKGNAKKARMDDVILRMLRSGLVLLLVVGAVLGVCDLLNGQFELKGVCFDCDPTCRTCNGPGGRRCTGCNNDVDKRDVYLYPEGTTCVEDCSRGFYKTFGYYPVCLPCDNNCSTCEGPNPRQCLSCYSNQLYHDGGPLGNQCLPKCAEGYEQQGRRCTQ